MLIPSFNEKIFAILTRVTVVHALADIECGGRKGVFPEAKIDPVIQIANYVVDHGLDGHFPH